MYKRNENAQEDGEGVACKLFKESSSTVHDISCLQKFKCA